MKSSGHTQVPAQAFPVELQWGARSDRGGRENNEDSYLVARIHRSFDALATNVGREALPRPLQQDGWFLVVADGLGGTAGGEVASAMAISAGVRIVLGEVRWNFRLDEKEIRALLQRAHRIFHSIDEEIADHAAVSKTLSGMGTTLTAAYVIGSTLLLLHVGDSRAYLFRGGKLRRLTRDQTLAQRLADDGTIPQEAAETHRLRHVLDRAVGRTGRELEIEARTESVREGDRLLLTTDGLIEEVSDEEIAEVLATERSEERVCLELVDRALERGASDNVTVVTASLAGTSGRA